MHRCERSVRESRAGRRGARLPRPRTRPVRPTPAFHLAPRGRRRSKALFPPPRLILPLRPSLSLRAPAPVPAPPAPSHPIYHLIHRPCPCSLRGVDPPYRTLFLVLGRRVTVRPEEGEGPAAVGGEEGALRGMGREWWRRGGGSKRLPVRAAGRRRGGMNALRPCPAAGRRSGSKRGAARARVHRLWPGRGRAAGGFSRAGCRRENRVVGVVEGETTGVAGGVGWGRGRGDGGGGDGVGAG